MFSKKTTKIDDIFTVNLTVATYCQIGGEDFVNFWGLLRKRELSHTDAEAGLWSLVFFVYKIHFLKLAFQLRISGASNNQNYF